MPLNIPGVPLATGKANLTPQVSDHPAHHNELAGAVNALEAQLRDTPDRLASLDTAVGNLQGRTGWRQAAVGVRGGASGANYGGADGTNGCRYRVIDGVVQGWVDWSWGGGPINPQDDKLLRLVIRSSDLGRTYAQSRLVGHWRGNLWPGSAGVYDTGPLVYTGVDGSDLLMFMLNSSGNTMQADGSVLTGNMYASFTFPTTRADTV